MIFNYILTIELPSSSTATLFPYTTLFRSSRGCSACKGDGRAAPACRRCRLPTLCLLGRIHGRWERHGRLQHQDRKSTRLNSSHTVISYAVFCLKKKKKK